MKLGNIIILTMLFSGCSDKDITNTVILDEEDQTTYEEFDNIQDSKLPIKYLTTLKNKCICKDKNNSTILINTYEDFEKVDSITIDLDDQYNYDFLNLMTNLKKIVINDNSIEGKCLHNIKGNTFKNNIKIYIGSDDENTPLNEERYAFLRDIPKIDVLYAGVAERGMTIDSDYIQSLRNVANLTIKPALFSNFTYKDLTYLKSLTLEIRHYDLPLYFSDDDIDELLEAGVNVRLTDHYDEYILAEEEIDKIIESFNLPDDASDIEKINAILTYVLSEFKYDKTIKDANEKHKDIPLEYHLSFYDEGALTGGIEMDTQICGNYASLTYVLGKRMGLDIYNVVSDNHVFNSIKIGDYYYFIDPTFLDDSYIKVKNIDGTEVSTIDALEALKNNDQETLNKFIWYLAEPNKIIERDEIIKETSHTPLYIPNGMTIEDIPEEDNFKQDNIYNYEDTKQILFCKFMINNAYYLLPASLLLGCLGGLGLGRLIYGSKKRKEKEAGHTK